MRNTIFNLIAGELILPSGWGFPRTLGEGGAIVEESEEAVGARARLFPFVNSDENAQLVRFYFGCVRSFPWIYRSFASDGEDYEPGKIFLSPLEAGDFKVAMRPGVGWSLQSFSYAGQVPALTGRLDYVSATSMALTLGSSSYTVNLGVSDTEGVYTADWPEELGFLGGIEFNEGVTYTVGWGTWVTLRPRHFDPTWLLRGVFDDQKFLRILLNQGLLDSFQEALTGEEKLAIVWLAVMLDRN